MFGMTEPPRSEVYFTPSLAKPGAAPVAVYSTVGWNQVRLASKRWPSSVMPAGLVSTAPLSSVAPMPVPPMAFWVGLKPIMRMPLVASAGLASAAMAATASRRSVFFMWDSPRW
jgi:hypothetical protein